MIKIKKKIQISIFFIVIIITSIIIKLSYGYEKVEMNTIYVSTTGSDENNDGSFDKPYLTVEKATSVATDNTIIYIRAGEYVFYNRAAILKKKNIIIEPYENEKVVFTTEHDIDVDKYSCGTATNEITTLENGELGIANNSNGNIQCIDFEAYLNDMTKLSVEESIDPAITKFLNKDITESLTEEEKISKQKENKSEIIDKFKEINQIKIYSGDEEIGVARYPNKEYNEVINQYDNRYVLIDDVSKTDYKRTFYLNNIIERNWNLDFYEENNMYVLGFWSSSFNSYYSKVATKNYNNKLELTLPEDSPEGIIRVNKRVIVFNVFEELDNYNEYYFDTKTNKLYVYKASIKNNNISFSFNYNLNSDDMQNVLIYLRGADNVTIQNINFKNIYTSVIHGTAYYKNYIGSSREISKSTENCIFENNTFKNIHNDALIFYDAQNNIVKNNYFSFLDNDAITFWEVGNIFQSKIMTQNNIITNNEIENFDKEVALKSGITLKGVGNIISHNEIHNSSYRAINLNGINNIVEYNEIYDVEKESGDGAAIYSASNLHHFGNTIQYNYIHDVYLRINNYILEGETDTPLSYAGVMAIYSDVNQWSTTVKNNIFYNVTTAYHTNGGSFNVFENNVLINSNKGFTFNYPSNYVEKHQQEITSLTSNAYYDKNIWLTQNQYITNNLLDNPSTEQIKKELYNFKGISIKNNIVFGNEDNSNINSCDDLKNKNNIGYNSFNFYKESDGVDITYYEDRPTPTLEEIKINNPNITFKDETCELQRKNVHMALYKTSVYHYSEPDNYTNDTSIFKNYYSKDFNLNLEEVQKYVTEFSDIHFNRIGKDKIVSIRLNVENIKNKYIQNYENLDLTGGKIIATYSDGNEKTINLSSAEIIGFDNTKTGKIELTAVYSNEKATFNVEIIEKSISGIEIATTPNKLKYLQNKEELDLTGGQLRIKYNDNTIENIDLKNVELTGFDNTKLGKQQMKVEYKGFETSFNIEIVEPKKVSSISIIQYPQKLQYIQNYENLNLSGGVLEVVYNDGTKELVNFNDNRVTVSGFNNNSLGQVELSLKIENITTKYNVEIVSKRVKQIAISTLPNKLKYIQNKENIDLSGGVLEITYDDNSTDKISMNNSLVTTSGYSNTELGSRKIRVLYQGKRVEFYVAIVAPEIEKIKINTLPIKTKYIINTENIDLTGGVLEVIYKDGTRDFVNMNNNNITINGFDNTVLGNNNIKLMYLDKEVNFDVEIIDKEINGIKLIKEPFKNKYIRLFEQLDLTGGVLEITYIDGTTSQISLTNEEIKADGFDNRTAGDNIITFEYKGKKIEYKVEIIEQGNSIMDFLNTNTTLINGLNIGLITSSVGLISFFIYQVQKRKKAENIA